MPFMDPAFVTAVCRYDLTEGPIKLSVPVSLAYTSVSFYTRYDIAYYAINDRAAGRRVIELDLMTIDQRNDMPDDEDITAADRLIVESPTETGLIAIRALAPEPGLIPQTQSTLAAAQCGPAGNAEAGALISGSRRGSVHAPRSAPDRPGNARSAAGTGSACARRPPPAATAS